MADAGERAATSLKRLDPEISDARLVARVERALRLEATALRQLARAADKRERSRYNQASSRVATYERALEKAFRQLADKGYVIERKR